MAEPAQSQMLKPSPVGSPFASPSAELEVVPPQEPGLEQGDGRAQALQTGCGKGQEGLWVSSGVQSEGQEAPGSRGAVWDSPGACTSVE